MKFKTKEELIKENKIGTEEHNDIIYGIKISFKNFKERVKFYKKYRYDWVSFKEDYPELSSEWTVNNYLEWIFDFCFGDIE